MFAAKHETTATTTTSAASDPSTTHDRLAALVAMASSSSSSAVKDEPCVPSEGDLARAMQDLQRAISAAVSSSSSGAPSTAAFTDCQAEPALPTCPRDRALARFWIDQGASDSLLDNKHFKDLIQALAPDYSLPTASALMQIATTQSHDHPSHE